MRILTHEPYTIELFIVEDCTAQAAEPLRARGIPVAFEMNCGRHFQDVPARIVRGIQALKER